MAMKAKRKMGHDWLAKEKIRSSEHFRSVRVVAGRDVGEHQCDWPAGWIAASRS